MSILPCPLGLDEVKQTLHLPLRASLRIPSEFDWSPYTDREQTQ
jgi:hypothetical protein